MPKPRIEQDEGIEGEGDWKVKTSDPNPSFSDCYINLGKRRHEIVTFFLRVLLLMSWTIVWKHFMSQGILSTPFWSCPNSIAASSSNPVKYGCWSTFLCTRTLCNSFPSPTRTGMCPRWTDSLFPILLWSVFDTWFARSYPSNYSQPSCLYNECLSVAMAEYYQMISVGGVVFMRLLIVLSFDFLLQ